MGVYKYSIKDSLKYVMRQKRGKDIQRRVSPATLLSQSWKGFLYASENKIVLFKFLAQQVAY